LLSNAREIRTIFRPDVVQASSFVDDLYLQILSTDDV